MKKANAFTNFIIRNKESHSPAILLADLNGPEYSLLWAREDPERVT